MITGYAIMIKNKIYVVKANTKRFTKAIADEFIKAPVYQELLKKHPDKLNPDILYRDMIDNKRYYKTCFEYIPEMITDEGKQPRYYVNTSSERGYYKPSDFIVLN